MNPKDLNKENNLFHQEVKDVKPLDNSNISRSQKEKPKPKARRRIIDGGDDIEDLTDDFSINNFVETDEKLIFSRPGIQNKVIKELKRGRYSIQDKIDLHGLTTEKAKKSLSRFFISAISNEIRCVLVIHGKGYSSVGHGPVIKSMVNSWLRKRDYILAFCSAKPEDGGTGAIYVLLRKKV